MILVFIYIHICFSLYIFYIEIVIYFTLFVKSKQTYLQWPQQSIRCLIVNPSILHRPIMSGDWSIHQLCFIPTRCHLKNCKLWYNPYPIWMNNCAEEKWIYRFLRPNFIFINYALNATYDKINLRLPNVIWEHFFFNCF